MQEIHRLCAFKALVILTASTVLLGGCRTMGDVQAQIAPAASENTQIAEGPVEHLEPAEALEEGTLNGIMPAAGVAGFADLPPVKVAILLPLSGSQKNVGQAMLQSAQLALFDIGYTQFELIPRDTEGNPQVAARAASEVIQDGAQLILGPLFSDSVHAVKDIAARERINVVAFSTDRSLAGGNAYIMSFMPDAQVRRVVSYAAAQGYKSTGLLAPQDAYGNAATQAFETAAAKSGIQVTRRFRFAPEARSVITDMQSFTGYDERPGDTLFQQASADDTRHLTDSGNAPPFQAVFMPVGGTQAEMLASGLSYYGLMPQQVRRLGTGLWDDPRIAQEKSMDGAWFAAPPPRLRKGFEQRYAKTYGANPPRLASMAYDATALAATLARQGFTRTGGRTPAYTRRDLTNPNGFAGIDGIFRFGSDGLVERGLSVFEIRQGRIAEIDPAPMTFQGP